MNSYIVMTSISPPTTAVREFARNSNYRLVVIGDIKTPADWNCEGVEYIDVQNQSKLSYQIIKHLPYNHYCRKMIGYLLSIEQKATAIIDTDDDNIPKAEWAFPNFEGEYESLANDLGFINIYQLFTDQKIWPRGLPLHLITTDFKLQQKISELECKVGVWQGLADEDPDVDAIYRLTNDYICCFKNRKPIVLGTGTITPFNSQNTIIRKELFPLLYLPAHVTFRFTDILRGLVAQPIMWLSGYQLGFTEATVVQKRNPHDYMKDFQSEVPMYLYCEKITETVAKVISSTNGVSCNLYEAYRSLLKAGIVTPPEMATLSAWLSDIAG
jgi:hypothetical protein